MSEPKPRPKQHFYKSTISWQGTKKGVVASLGKPDLLVAPPPEFKGYVGFWTPEDLLVAAVNSCLMMTFLFYMEREGLAFLSYQCEAEGILEVVDKELMVTQVKLLPRIFVDSGCDTEKVKTLLKLSEENCFISNSIKARIELIPEINKENHTSL